MIFGALSGKKSRLLVHLSLKVVRFICAETSVNNYQTTQKKEVGTSKQCCYLEVSCFFFRKGGYCITVSVYLKIMRNIAMFGAWLCTVLKRGRSGQQIRNAWKVLKCGAGEGWRRSGGPIMREMKKCYLESMSRGISYMK